MDKTFSGIVPSGNLHIGNYLGAVKQWLVLQNEYDATFAVMNLHAITTPQDPEKLAPVTLEIAKIYLAAGIDPLKCTLFIQSHVPEHVELSWILGTLARRGDLDKMTQFKDKSAKEGSETAGIGLYTYPILQAADILLYDTAVVPVGEDQLQHIELARTLARRFNERFGETFVVPVGRIQKEGARIMGLDDATKKMSKSAPSEYNYIALTDDEATVLRKVKKAVTDSGSEITYSDDKPALKNLINIHSLFSEKSPEEIVSAYRGKGYGDFKTGLAETISSFLTPFQKRLAALTDEEVTAILIAGAEKARAQAKAKMEIVRKRVGLI